MLLDNKKRKQTSQKNNKKPGPKFCFDQKHKLLVTIRDATSDNNDNDNNDDDDDENKFLGRDNASFPSPAFTGTFSKYSGRTHVTWSFGNLMSVSCFTQSCPGKFQMFRPIITRKSPNMWE